jgi:hypothetical protein
VHDPGAVLGEVQGPKVGKEEAHSAGASLPGVSWNAILTPSMTWVSRRSEIVQLRRDQRGHAAPDALAQTAVDMRVGTGREVVAELEERAPPHRHAGQHVLGHRLLHEAGRRDHRHLATGRVLEGHHAARPPDGRNGCGCR